MTDNEKQQNLLTFPKIYTNPSYSLAKNSPREASFHSYKGRIPEDLAKNTSLSPMRNQKRIKKRLINFSICGIKPHISPTRNVIGQPNSTKNNIKLNQSVNMSRENFESIPTQVGNGILIGGNLKENSKELKLHVYFIDIF